MVFSLQTVCLDVRLLIDVVSTRAYEGALGGWIVFGQCEGSDEDTAQTVGVKTAMVGDRKWDRAASPSPLL